ncbi:rifamycin-inactivating phosphotransferase [Pseudonocardia humida]|uniref:Phosphoenolpyruvate synthase n=1 Tax=Pseudonocardia humida TaxID=2800819 RepID=A0ABT1AD11_9PSEU|nr:rifamycin-inactivating phosphotransferase [Pseudonocardia humida]MCO1660813.1 phosphoenolpyruvate synthase [Pseudonocardia humida]
MNPYVLDFEQADGTRPELVGGKGANLAELSRLRDLGVPTGFCVTTEAYASVVGRIPGFAALLDRLADATDRVRITAISAELRSAIEATEIPDDIAQPVLDRLTALGPEHAYAVRSSATAEDLPTTSFAGQQDTYLNVRGGAAVLDAVRRCWASLFTDRAVVYRMQNGFDDGRVQLAVVVQRMVAPDAAGVMFTADPVTSDRTVVSIDAGFGLGEALVSGLVNPDTYRVRADAIVNRTVSSKERAIVPSAGGGTEQRTLGPRERIAPALTDPQILRLAAMGRRIERSFGRPQDIEWALAGDTFHILQSRPITTLYPVPAVSDGRNHVYMSIGHQQMMTDAWKPLGLSLFPMWLRKISNNPMVELGNRPYMDVSPELASARSRRTFVRNGLGSVDPLIQKALENVLGREEFVRCLFRGKPGLGLNGGSVGDLLSGLRQAVRLYRKNDPTYVDRVATEHDELVRGLAERMRAASGVEVVDLITRDVDEAFRLIVLANYGAGILGYFTPTRLNRNLTKWLGEKNAVDALSQGVTNNVTTEMGLALLDVADVVRQHPAVLEHLPRAHDETFFAELRGLAGGPAVADSLARYLDRYGMRCPGEIDISTPRWAERPTQLVPLVLNDVRNFPPDARKKIRAQKQAEVQRTVADLLARIERLPAGRRKAARTAKQISVFRNFVGFREYPKYAMLQRFAVYRRGLLAEADRLVADGVLADRDDVFFLALDEFRQVLDTGQLDGDLIARRRSDHAAFERLSPPRVMTSDGEVVQGRYDNTGVPAGALVGTPVSAGVVEGRARVARRLEDARVEEGDVLVTTFTDPSWTSLFVSITGLVTEVGGMMTHGAVVAREYGLPAVVSVPDATTRIADGQRIRVDGTAGYVEILP